MARGKKAKTGGKSRGTPRRSNSFVRASSAWSQDESDFTPASFTLQDAARNLSHRPAALSSQTNLRHKSLQFVRASEGLKGTIQDTQENPIASSVAAENNVANEVPAPTPAAPERSALPSSVDPAVPSTQAPETTQEPHPLTSHFEEDLVRPSSPSPSNSSEEVVLFTGRQKRRADKHTPSVKPEHTPPIPLALETAHETSSSQRDLQSRVAPEKIHDVVQSNADAAKVKEARPRSPARNRRRRTKSSWRTTSNDEGTDTDAFLADYMDNLRAYGELDDDFVAKASARQPDLNGWDVEDLDDFGDLSTSDEILDCINQVLSKRERPSGIQYLVVWEGHNIDDARWIHQSCLKMEGAAKMLEEFEEREKLVAEYQSGTESVSQGDDTDDEEVIDSDFQGAQAGGEQSDTTSAEEEDFLDEEDLIARRIERMSDEQIARLLAKQEELGMGSDELLLFDDDGDEAGDGMEEDELDEDFIPISSSSKARGRTTKSHRQPRSYNPWKAGDNDFGDLFGSRTDFGGFDVMDFDRPSLASKSGKKKEPKFDLSDSELEATLRDQWATDRSKKRAKKQEREEMRAQGMLGRKQRQKPDLAARYSEGLSLADVMFEFEQFLSTNWESRPFPPMDKRSRKGLHELAAKFNLKSKSVGSGKDRFPVLYKTRKTLPFNESLFFRTGRRYFPRMDTTPGKRPKRAKHGGGGGGGHVSYMEGDTVGQSAPEIGIENRGRAMLEKMGWSKGMALGSLNNQGITEPIAHIVKKSRTGLG